MRLLLNSHLRARVLLYLFIVVLGTVFFHAALAQRSLFSDGSYFFLKSLTAGFYDDSSRQRLFVNVLNQLPLKLARLTNTNSYDLFAFVFSFPLFFWPLLVVALSSIIYIKRNQYSSALLPPLLYLTFAAPSLIFSINPAFLFFSLNLLNSVILSTPSLHTKHKLFLVMLALFSLRSHEAILLTSPILIVYLTNRWRLSKDSFLSILVVLYFISFIYSLWFNLNAPPGGESYISAVFDLVKRPYLYIFQTNLIVSLVSFGLVVFSVVLSHLPKGFVLNKVAYIKPGLLVSALTLFTSHFFRILQVQDVSPPAEYTLRFLITIGTVLSTLLLFIQPKVTNRLLSSRFITGVFIVQLVFNALWQVNGTFRWQQFYQSSTAFTQTLKASSRVDLKQIAYPDYQVAWTWPVFSMILQQGTVRVLILPETKIDFEKDWLSYSTTPKPVLSTPFSTWESSRYLNLRPLIFNSFK